MYNIVKTAILSGGYKLLDMQRKINKLWLSGHITETEADELLAMASGGVNADAERPETLAMIKNLSEKIDVLTERVAFLERIVDGNPPDVPSVDEPEAVEEWKPWDGISDKYQKNAVVTHIGKVWISHFEGQNVWEPGTPGTESMWVEYITE